MRCMVVLPWAAPSFPMPSIIKIIVAIAVSVGVCCGLVVVSTYGDVRMHHDSRHSTALLPHASGVVGVASIGVPLKAL